MSIDLDRRVLDAARRAVEEDGARAVVLFGSRARGDERPDSDVDLLVVGDEETSERAALILYRRLKGDADVLARDERELRERTCSGTVWGSIVREGVVVMGELKGLREIEIMPTDAETIGEALGTQIAIAVTECIRYLAESFETSERALRMERLERRKELERDRIDLQKTAARRSVEAVEHVTRGLAELVGARVERRHNLHQAYEKLRERAMQHAPAEEDSPDERSRKLKRRIGLLGVAERVMAMNGSTRKVHTSWYTGYEEDPYRTLERALNAMSLQAEALRGILSGDGRLGWLDETVREHFANHPHGEREKRTLHEFAKASARRIEKCANECAVEAGKIEDRTTRQGILDACRRWKEEAGHGLDGHVGRRAAKAEPSRKKDGSGVE